MKEKQITNTEKYWSQYGIRTSPQASGGLVQIPWNLLLLEALLTYEENDLASRLFSQLVKGMSEQIRSSGGLYPGIDSKTGKGFGAMVSAAGLMPTRLLLKLAGIEFCRNTLIGTGGYFLDFPLTIQYHGIEITRNKEFIVVSIPGEEPRTYTGDQEFAIEFS